MNFDHILLVGYGAPVKVEEVMPFLRSMSEGRGISEERLKIIAKHYEVIGGSSPYNQQVMDFKNRLAKELRSVGGEAPVFTGMKNWHPFLGDVLREIHQKGLRKGLAIPLTPFRSASSGAGYKKNLEAVCLEPGMNGLSYQWIEGWCDQELFIEVEAEEISRALQTIDPAEQAGVPVLFSFHSLPVHCDPADPVSRYADEARAASALVAERLGYKKWAVVYQSRPVSACEDWPSRPRERAGTVGIPACEDWPSRPRERAGTVGIPACEDWPSRPRERAGTVGIPACEDWPPRPRERAGTVGIPAKTAWLRPEIEEEIKSLAAKGEKRVLVVPLGFLCDHAEILYDLDHAAREIVENSGMQYLRAKTVLHHPKITTLIKALILKQMHDSA